MLKLDLGCGPNKCGPDWTGVDVRDFKGVDIITNLAERRHDLWCRTRSPESSSAIIIMSGHGKTCDCTAYARDAVPTFEPWPWADGTVDEVHCSHFLEHLDVDERVHFVNELWRVLKPEGTARIITPYGFSDRAFGDLTHKWPPVHSFWYFYLNADWRASQAPHNDRYRCHFMVGHQPALRPDLQVRNAEFQQAAYQEQINAATDLHALFTKKPMPAPPG